MSKIERILLVEDDFYIRDIYGTVLKKSGYTVDMAENGNEALNKIKEFKPDLILLDIMIPGVDGLQVLKTLKTDQEYKETHAIVVMVTNLAQSDVADEARKLGADGYIIKANIKPTELVATIKSYDNIPR